MNLILTIFTVVILLLLSVCAGYTMYYRFKGNINNKQTLQRLGILFTGAFLLVSIIEVFKGYFV